MSIVWFSVKLPEEVKRGVPLLTGSPSSRRIRFSPCFKLLYARKIPESLLLALQIYWPALSLIMRDMLSRKSAGIIVKLVLQ